MVAELEGEPRIVFEFQFGKLAWRLRLKIYAPKTFVGKGVEILDFIPLVNKRRLTHLKCLRVDRVVDRFVPLRQQPVDPVTRPSIGKSDSQFTGKKE